MEISTADGDGPVLRCTREETNPSKAKNWACRSCQTRKIKCDGGKPLCSTCTAHKRDCFYAPWQPKLRSRVPGSRRHALECRKDGRHNDHPSRRTGPSSSTAQSPRVIFPHDNLNLNQSADTNVGLDAGTRSYFTPGSIQRLPGSESSQSGQVDVTTHLGFDKSGDVEVRGPTNTLYEAHAGDVTQEQEIPDRYASAILTANAATERQKEAGYREVWLARGDIEGVSAELALHLLDIHWSRHHFFLITYRPAFYRDMMNGGPYYSSLLFFAIMAVSSRYSERLEVGGGDHSEHSGLFFYQKAKELLVDAMDKSSIPTATALLLLGNALVSAGQIDRGWLYTGMGIRMIINLGLHLDINQAPGRRKKQTLEDIEIRKRVFWGAFVAEKLQSLYLGRPMFMRERDVHVPKTFLDMYEEEEVWVPFPDQGKLQIMAANSVSNFIAQCNLSEICENIMSSFYAVKAKNTSTKELQESRSYIRQRLFTWMEDLPEKLRFTPWSNSGHKIVPIHVIVLHTIYLSLVILLERPFVANGHLISNAENMGSWVDCTIAAEKITYLLQAYRNFYTFRRVPYQLCYAVYVASTILVRNANSVPSSSASVRHLAICLKGFEEMKIAHPGTTKMETVIRSLMQRLSVNIDFFDLSSLGAEASSPNLHLLPSPNFNTTLSAIENRNIDLAVIRQSFAPQHPPEAVENLPQSNGPGVEFQIMSPVAGTGQENPYEIGGAFTDFSWNISGERANDDLLFGILEDNSL